MTKDNQSNSARGRLIFLGILVQQTPVFQIRLEGVTNKEELLAGLLFSSLMPVRIRSGRNIIKDLD